MTAVDDLNSAVTALQTEQAALATQATAVVTAVTDLVNEVANLNAGVSNSDDAAIEAAVDNINAITGYLTSTATDLATAASSDPGAQTTPPADSVPS
jgi:hypothetical protein